ncbi:MAG: hypothetical protein QXF26_00640 [Candidatus Bathyarchaeia archaeon]
MKSSIYFILQDVPTDGGISLSNLAPEIAFGDAYFLSRIEGDPVSERRPSYREHKDRRSAPMKI